MLETQQSAATFGAHDESGTTSTVRLVIRARILPDRPTPAVNSDHALDPRRIAFAGIAVLALIAILVALFRHDPVRHDSNGAVTRTETPSVSAPVVVEQSIPTPSPPAEASMPDPNIVINEVMPSVSRASLQTIHGTIKVVIRVLVNQDGSVRAASSHISGPSRYFERVALQAAKKWTFAPTNANAPRTFLVRFNFTRDGVTGGAERFEKSS